MLDIVLLPSKCSSCWAGVNQQPPMHQLWMSPLRPFFGWTKIPSSLPAYYYFSYLFSTPKFSPLLPTTYQPLPPPLTPLPELQGRRAGESLEQGSLEGSLEQRAWSRGASGAGAGPMWEPERDLGKHLTFFSLVYFVCLFVELLCSAAPQHTLHYSAA
jgi:hypothetical protein